MPVNYPDSAREYPPRPAVKGEVHDILAIDIPLATRGLVASRVRQDVDYVDAYFGHGLTLRAKRWYVFVIAEDPTDEVVEALEASKQNFLVLR